MIFTPTQPLRSHTVCHGQAEGQALLDELLDPRERGQRGEGWVAAQLVALVLLLFPPAVLRTLVDDSGVGLMVLGVVLMCALRVFT